MTKGFECYSNKWWLQWLQRVLYSELINFNVKQSNTSRDEIQFEHWFQLKHLEKQNNYE